MSEKQSLYLAENEIILDSFTHLTIDGADYSSKVDKVVLSRIEPLWEYSVSAYKGELPVWQLSKDKVLDTVYYEKSIWLNGTYYEVLTKNAIWKTTFVSILENEVIDCPFCLSRVFPEPKQYCEHVAFVHAEDYEGIWVYWDSNKEKLW